MPIEQIALWVMLGLSVIVGLVVFVWYMRVGALWMTAFLAQVPISMTHLIGMSLKKIKPGVIVGARVMAARRGLPPIDVESLERHYLAGGSPLNVVQAMDLAGKSGVDLSFEDAAAIDLGNPNTLARVLETPDNAFDDRHLEAAHREFSRLRDQYGTARERI